MTGALEATGTPRDDDRVAAATASSEPIGAAPAASIDTQPGEEAATAPVSAVDATRFAHASEAEMARILDFYAVRWDYEPTTFPILWNLEGEVIESFAPDFYLPDLEVFLEMTTLKQRLVRKKNRKLRRLRELYPDIRIKLFYARDFRAMMLKYGRLGLAASLSGTPGQVVPVRPPVIEPVPGSAIDVTEPATIEDVIPVAEVAIDATDAPAGQLQLPAASAESPVPAVPRATPRTRSGRRRRHAALPTQAAGAERESGG